MKWAVLVGPICHSPLWDLERGSECLPSLLSSRGGRVLVQAWLGRSVVPRGRAARCSG